MTETASPHPAPVRPGAAGPAATAGLREAVLNDDQRDIGVPMLLHTAESLHRSAAAEPLSTAAYRHQGALGRRLLEDGALAEPVDLPVLALNFHAVPAAARARAAERIRRVVRLGWPEVMVAFYDGDRETGLFGAALCAELGVRAFFFPLLAPAPPPAPVDRLSDDQLAEIASQHELCFHTASHRAAAEVTGDTLATEVLEPFDRLTRLAGRPPRLAAWRGGARFDQASLGDRTLLELGVQSLVSNWSVEPLPQAQR